MLHVLMGGLLRLFRAAVTAGSPSDEALFLAYRDGDSEAFAQLWDRWAGAIRRAVGRWVGRSEEAEELVQQTFLQLHRSRRDFRTDAAFRPWLFTIARNLARDHSRRRARRGDDGALHEGNEPRSEAHDPSARDEVRRVRRALAALPEAQREVIELHWLHGLDFKEVARVVGASHGAVKVRAHRGYGTLRSALREADE